jgi:hypothetical protein
MSNWEHAEAVVEILAEPPLVCRLDEITVRRCDDPHAHLARQRGAQPGNLAVLQGPEQLGLKRRIELADLVEEQCATVGDLESAGASLFRQGGRGT